LIAALTKLGVSFHTEDRLLGFAGRGRVEQANMAWGPIRAGAYLVCLGAWTGELLGEMRVPCKVKPVRGQMLLLRTPEPVIRRVILEGRRYLVPRDDGRVLVGSTEEDVGFDPSTTREVLDDLRRFAAGLVPDLARARVERSWAGLRPGNADGLPTLGRVPGFENLWVAAGHYRAGIQLSPATGLIMAQAIRGEPTDVPLSAFRADRDPANPVRPAFQS
jgi:glycine oxidase